jgi:hypothetical protein
MKELTEKNRFISCYLKANQKRERDSEKKSIREKFSVDESDKNRSELFGGTNNEQKGINNNHKH